MTNGVCLALSHELCSTDQSVLVANNPVNVFSEAHCVDVWRLMRFYVNHNGDAGD